MKPAIYTIGYEGVTVEAFVAALTGAGIEALLDIRAVPLSRKPGFSKNKLAERVGAAGIRYVPMKRLGTPAEGRAAARKGKAGELRRIYEEHLGTEEAIEDMNRALEMVQNTKCCLLCFEHAPGCCHRLIVAERLAEATGQTIEHLDPVAASLL